MIELRDVYKSFGDRQILNGMTLSVPKGKNYVLMGRSGIGKSVTLKHIVGILKADRGRVLVDEQEVAELSTRSDLRAACAAAWVTLFQNGALINWLTVAENVGLPLRERGRACRSPRSWTSASWKCSRLVGMAPRGGQLPGRASLAA